MVSHVASTHFNTRTKIVCTIGPASNTPQKIRQLAQGGADVFRLNFSHGTHDDHRSVIRIIRDMGFEMSRPFAILADLSGPKLRISKIKGGEKVIEQSELITLTSDVTADGTDNKFGVNFDGFHEVAQPGEHILLDDGRFMLVVENVNGNEVQCRVMNGGILKSRKGVNLPDTKLPIPALTDKDRVDLKFAMKEKVDVVALSFVRSPEDIAMTRLAMEECGHVVPILAKIEKKEAVANLEQVLYVADGAMVARGDLGIEVPMEQVPAIQKRIIRMCNRLAKPVITATQMLESMMTNPRPTRAEVTDIYNAIIDGTDAVMLSGETAAGEYPVEAVEVMDTVAQEAQKMLGWNKGLDWVLSESELPTVTHAICDGAVRLAEKLKLDLILIPTYSGYSAYHVSRFRPSIPIFACSVNSQAVNALCLAWGVVSRQMSHLNEEEVKKSNGDALVNEAIRTAKYYEVAKAGMRVVVLGGIPLGQVGHTNFLRVVEIE